MSAAGPAPRVAAHRGGAALWPENGLTAFRNAFGSVTTDPNYVPFLDFNGDGAINGTDLTQFRNRFGVILP